jgi:hypothetical protein
VIGFELPTISPPKPPCGFPQRGLWIVPELGSASNPSRETYFGLCDSDRPGLLSQFGAFSPRFSLLLLFYKVVENNVAGNCVDGQDLPPVTDDHKIQVRIRGRDESTRAVRIYGVGARNIHWRD